MALLKLQPALAAQHRVQPPSEALTGPERTALNGLRLIAMSCRASARADLFQACALLSVERDVARDAHARALTRCLRQAIGVRPVFYHPGEVDVSFDEAWIMRALKASQAGDTHSCEFLLRSRIPQRYRRHIAFLLHGMAARLHQF